MRASLHAALRLLARWELWVLVGGGMACRLLQGPIWDAMAESGPRPAGSLYSPAMVSMALWCAWLGVSMVLLLPLVQGGRGLRMAIVSRQVTTALAGTGIALGLHIAVLMIHDWMAGSGGFSPRTERMVSFLQWLLVDLAILLCAWYVHGKGEEAAGRQPPGALESFWKGLVTWVLGLFVPGMLLKALLEMADPWNLEGRWYASTMASYLFGACAVPLVFGAWFMGALGKGEPGEEPSI